MSRTSSDSSPVVSPCRLFVYIAGDAPVAVVLRRGPSDWARLSLWHTDTDTFEHGQWIKGRIYERRSDVSADGSLFVAFVRQSGGRASQQPAAADTWLSVSRPPFFTALAVWFVGGTYHTGGFFPRPSSLWTGFVEQPPDSGDLPRWLKITPPREIPYIDGTNEWTDRTVHFNRLLRDGWKLVENEPYATTWERVHPSKPITLLMTHRFEGFGTYGGPYVVRYSLRDESGNEIDLGEASSADWDQRGRLFLTRDGRLSVWDSQSELQQLEDFNGQSPDPQPAPDWAREWPKPVLKPRAID
jgi:hypothetical protein